MTSGMLIMNANIFSLEERKRDYDSERDFKKMREE